MESFINRRRASTCQQRVTAYDEVRFSPSLNTWYVLLMSVFNENSMHSGATSGSVQMNFGRCERVAYKDVITLIFSRFLRKCYCKYKI